MSPIIRVDCGLHEQHLFINEVTVGLDTSLFCWNGAPSHIVSVQARLLYEQICHLFQIEFEPVSDGAK